VTLLAHRSTDLPRREKTIGKTGYRLRRDFGAIRPTGFYDNLRSPFAETLDDLDALRGLPEGWNGYDAAPPDHNAIEQARSWIGDMYEDVEAIRRSWHNPHVSANEDGDVAFEWWNEDKVLTVYVSRDEARYIIGWGLNIETDMENGQATTSQRRRKLWAWLTK
jgi:hypothetical protein